MTSAADSAGVWPGGLDPDLGVDGRLVGIRHAGELGDLAGARLRVEPFTSRASQSSSVVATWTSTKLSIQPRTSSRTLAVRGDRGRHRDHAVAGEQRGDESDPEDVGVAVLLREAEALREVLAHFVAVEQLDLAPRARSSATTISAIVLLPAPEAR